MKTVKIKVLFLFTPLLLLLLPACAATPVPNMFIADFNEAASDPAHSKCMNENAMFNNRQLMVAPSAVANLWTKCLNQFGTIAPGQEEDETVIPDWDD
jgi:hypothetical protein